MESGYRTFKQAGNVMLYVLIGVILFAALIFTVARSDRSSSIASDENNILYAQAITSYADKINGAVQNVMLQNGCLGSQISFENTVVAGYTNGASPVNKKCNIFNSAGGGMNFEKPPAAALDTAAAAASAFPAGGLVGDFFFTGNVCVDGVGTGPIATCSGDGLPNEELLLVLPWVNASVCAAINKLLENSAPMLQDSDGSYDTTKFTGTYPDGFALGKSGFTAYHAGCYQSTGGSPGNGYHFYYTLLAR